MKQLKVITRQISILETRGTTGVGVSDIAFDSRQVTAGCLFVAVPGTQMDGHDFIDQATINGASVIVCQQFPKDIKTDVTYLRVENSAIALGYIASAYYDHPSTQLQLVGITGTNGKTTTATLLYNLFTRLGFKSGLISTILIKVAEKELPATHTTPDAIRIQKTIRQMVDEGGDFAFMEVSSHAIQQDRIAGLTFAGAVFTNITHDHLDYHKSFRNYINAKKKLFDHLPSEAFALSNADDKNGKIMLQNTKAGRHTYGIKSMAGFRARVVENHFSGMKMLVDGHELHTLLPGSFNAYNILATYATAILLIQKKEEVLTALSQLSGAEGRFEIIRSKTNITGIVDYAHTPDALENVLSSINSLRTKNEQLITVVGAGGDRDKAKRPVMASIASQHSNMVILTSDNPRTEDPETILDEMRKGVDEDMAGKTLVINNRKEAIKTAVALARPGDIVLVAGKGHEKYQEIMGVKHPFDDKQLLTEYLQNA